MDEREVGRRLRALVAASGSQAAAAKVLGISASYLSDMLADRRTPGPRVLKRLKLRRVTGYDEVTR